VYWEETSSDSDLADCFNCDIASSDSDLADVLNTGMVSSDLSVRSTEDTSR